MSHSTPKASPASGPNGRRQPGPHRDQPGASEMKPVVRKLADEYSDFVSQRSEEHRASCQQFDRENRRQIARLAARGVSTVNELIAVLPQLPPKLKEFGIWWFQVTRPRGAELTLLRMFHHDEPYRLACASALAMIGGRRSIRQFLRVGATQLASKSPDRNWLAAVIQGIKFLHNPPPEAEEMLLTIYERTDLPGWLRGEAGDALGCCGRLLCDRRTSLFRRAWRTAISGIDDADIEVKFWSMYVIMQLAQNYSSNRNRSNTMMTAALPRLREIAATDHRLAPGFWWPMSAEAEDAIAVIQSGNGLEVDAADRWHGQQERGPITRDG